MSQLLVRGEIEFDTVLVLEREDGRVSRGVVTCGQLHVEFADLTHVVDHPPEDGPTTIAYLVIGWNRLMIIADSDRLDRYRPEHSGQTPSITEASRCLTHTRFAG